MPRRDPPCAALLDRLRAAELEVVGRMPWSSNGTFLVKLLDESGEPTGDRAIYKPQRGERPLWDFPSGLYRREVAAYELSAALGWFVVPPTVVRDGPMGEGSAQLFVEADFEQHYFTAQERDDLRWDFQAICALDLVMNNTDRKSGHCLLGRDGHVWAIDNGLCFAADYKLRTVIWEYGGERLPPDLLDDLRALREGALPEPLVALLDDDEVEALEDRLTEVVEVGRYPVDRSGYRYPWPLV